VLLQKPAAAALTNLLRGTSELKAAVASAPEAIASLVTALSANSLELQTVAAAALGELCARNAANKQAVAASPGAVARLVAMLDTSDDSSSGSSDSSSSVVGSAAGPPGGTAASVQVMSLVHAGTITCSFHLQDLAKWACIVSSITVTCYCCICLCTSCASDLPFACMRLAGSSSCCTLQPVHHDIDQAADRHNT
jgi:hypothetical protein